MTPKIIEAAGLKWVLHLNSGDYLGPSPHETSLVGIAGALLQPGGVFLDIGAHVGLYSLRLASKARLVLAIEANPQTASVLGQNIELNHLEEKIRLIHAGAWFKDGEPLALESEDPEGFLSSGSTKVLPAVVSKPSAVSLKMDTLLEDVLQVDLVKIDVESQEYNVLLGMLDTLRKKRPILMIEMHGFMTDNPAAHRAEILELLDDVGYVWGQDIPNGHGYELICKPSEMP